MNYYDIMSAMPTLTFGSPPPMSPEAFVQSCEGRMPTGDAEEFQRFISGRYAECASAFARKWADFEQTLRLEVAGLRAARWKLDPAEYASYGHGYDSFIDRTVVDAFAKSNPRAREQVLDRARWQELDDLIIQTPFGLAAVLASFVKLQLMTRWYGIHREKGWEQVRHVLDAMIPQIREARS